MRIVFCKETLDKGYVTILRGWEDVTGRKVIMVKIQMHKEHQQYDKS